MGAGILKSRERARLPTGRSRGRSIGDGFLAGAAECDNGRCQGRVFSQQRDALQARLDLGGVLLPRSKLPSQLWSGGGIGRRQVLFDRVAERARGVAFRRNGVHQVVEGAYSVTVAGKFGSVS